MLICGLAIVAGGILGFILGGVLGRIVFRAPPGQTVVMKVGRQSLGTAIGASLYGGLLVAALITLPLFIEVGLVPAGIVVLAGVVAALFIGCMAALL